MAGQEQEKKNRTVSRTSSMRRGKRWARKRLDVKSFVSLAYDRFHAANAVIRSRV